jgi:hypothetical protein
MKIWRDFAEKSVLTVIFGVVSGEIYKLDAGRYGCTTHPGSTWEHHGTLAEAKVSVENNMRSVLTEALGRLNA